MDVIIDPSWKQLLAKEFDAPYFNELSQFVDEEYKQQQCYPQKSHVFTAFNHTPLESVKVVILGQDPYHGPQQANGLCFSVADGIAQPPSLRNIFKEIKTDLQSDPPVSGNLERWAQQGVLLLNATLTVRAQEAGSHQRKGWEQFTDEVITQLSAQQEQIVFLLWGGYAKKKGAKIDRDKHLVLTSGHPSPLSANRGYWFGNQHFSKTNDYLIQHNKKPIVW
jgi:uracil-DNA glycosylase